MSHILKVPKFAELPIVDDAPKGYAWGVFDGKTCKDRMGTLNFITSQTIVDASKEIKSGESCVLK